MLQEQGFFLGRERTCFDKLFPTKTFNGGSVHWLPVAERRDLSLVLRNDIAFIVLHIEEYTESLLVLRELRDSGVIVPIFAFVLSGVTLPKSFSELLGAGADDAQHVSITSDEFYARLNALMRRDGTKDKPNITLCLGRITIDLLNESVLVDGVKVHFTNNEWAIIKILAAQKNRQYISGENIHSLIYSTCADCDAPTARVIEVTISKIRRRLTEALGIPKRGRRHCSIVENVPNKGYRLLTLSELPPEVLGTND